MPRIGSGGVYAVIELLIGFVGFVLLVFCQLFELIAILFHGFREVGKLVRQNIGVGEAHYHRADGL